ncbi:MAG: hypothetical protein CM1200mP29_05830 [Verrucomicrobiota bacterium]|nr:MAG: hypothetical protein CM1200mP29_05830 [Verrucomicrobiota bacterium]
MPLRRREWITSKFALEGLLSVRCLPIKFGADGYGADAADAVELFKAIYPREPNKTP